MPHDDGPPALDTSLAHPARRYDYWLGGKDNFAADRKSGDAIAAVYPSVREAAVENRKFLRRAVEYQVRDAGIRQFLDVGTGIPTANNTHEVAQAIAPDTKVVYVDNDPIVLSHARALLTGTRQGVTTYLDADAREPANILDHARTILDFGQPIGLMLVALLHFIPDTDNAHGLVAELAEALPPGSHLTISHATSQYLTPEQSARLAAADARSPSPVIDRRLDEFTRFFQGLTLVEPGITTVAEWRNDEPARLNRAEVSFFGAVARKP